MSGQLQLNWKNYFIEAWALGMFMLSACFFVIVFEHPNFNLATFLPNAFLRRVCIAAAMGLTAIVLIYSKWGKQSGAHMNPAVTLANFFLDRISMVDAIGYIVAQLVGASMAMLLMNLFFPSLLNHTSVNYIVTMPGSYGVVIAFMAEFFLSLIMFGTVLIISNSKMAKYTGYFAGLLVFLFISLEAPLSGMSINPSRSFAPALIANNWSSFWIYLFAPIIGMQLAAFLYRTWYYGKKGQCKSLHCFMSGNKYNNSSYHVYKWTQKSVDGQKVTVYNSSKK